MSTIKIPTKGAYFIEQMVDQLIEKSWSLFQQIESNGGVVESQKWLMEEVQRNSDVQKEQIQTGKRVIIGVNKYQPKS